MPIFTHYEVSMSLSFVLFKLTLDLLPDLVKANDCTLCDLNLNDLSRYDAHVDKTEGLWDASALGEEGQICVFDLESQRYLVLDPLEGLTLLELLHF